MRFKVGDLVEYRGVTVRVMRAKDGDITLAKFGSFREDNPEIKLVLSATLPELKTGDLVRVCGIPESEKHAYGCFKNKCTTHYTVSTNRIRGTVI